MIHKLRFSAQWTLSVVIGVCLLALFVVVRPAAALTPIPTPEPKPGSFGLEATKTQPPPTQGATITTPGSGGSYSTSPLTVNGICPTGLLVQILNNGVMVGSVMCTNGSFSLQVSLFAGTNELSALVYDDLDQPGPVSNVVTVTYNDTSFTAFGSLITLTSSFGRRSAAANSPLSWPLQLSGGTGPYAFSIDWGDGTPTDLKSQPLAGVVTIAHTYKRAGIYQVNIKVTDVNGVSAFLQVIALANGKVDGVAATGAENGDGQAPKEVTKVMWAPAAISSALMLPAFWLGRKSQLVSLRNKLMKDRDKYQQS